MKPGCSGCEFGTQKKHETAEKGGSVHSPATTRSRLSFSVLTRGSTRGTVAEWERHPQVSP
jgi:hypothetical protein